jgi:hypothetical protein
MTGHPRQRLRTAAALLLCIQASLFAEDIVTKSGQVLRNAQIVADHADQVTIRHLGGTETFAAAEIPEPVRRRFRDEEFRRKADEVQKLKQDLARRESELKRLREENDRLHRDAEQRRAREAADLARRNAELETLKEENQRLARERKPIPPSPPLETLPELQADAVVEARDIVLYYRADLAAAEQRFKKRTFRIRGAIERFEPRMFMRRYDVLLESPDKSVSVVCKFTYAEGWTAVYTKDRGRDLVAKEGPSETRLMKAGDTVTLRARCEGLKGSELEFSRCEQVR